MKHHAHDPQKTHSLPVLGNADEFADGASEWPEGMSRRSFLRLMGASLALAGLCACSDRPKGEKLVPYANAPEAVVPGNPLAFATAFPMHGFGVGALAISREGRPIKIEGNPDHPSSLGGTDAFMQASILTLYDPARARAVAQAGNASSWNTFWQALQPRLRQLEAEGGAGLRILAGLSTSPTLAWQLQQLMARFPQARWHQHDPVTQENMSAGLRAAFGRPLHCFHDLSRAKVIITLDSDLLMEGPGHIRYARQFADGRRVRRGQTDMNRLYAVESTLTITGSMADHRLPVRPAMVGQVARAIAAACGVTGVGDASSEHASWVRAVADDLLRHRGACLVVAGESQPPAVHALAHAMNFVLGNAGTTVHFAEPIEAAPPGGARSLDELVGDMRAGRVNTLLILADNPAWTAPADVAFAEALARLSTATGPDGRPANFTAHLSAHYNETSFACQWHLPETHYLEQWGDVRAHDGAASIIQPLIAPLHDGHSAHELLAAMLGRPAYGGYEIVRDCWRGRTRLSGDAFEAWWEAGLKRGVLEGTAARTVPAGRPQLVPIPSPAEPAEPFDIVFRSDYTVDDGFFAHNVWMQELPKPFTKLVWDNAALMSPRMAAKFGVTRGDIVRLSFRGRSVDAAVMPLPGVPDGVVTAHLGYGRKLEDAGIVGQDASHVPGFNAYAIRTSDALWFGAGLGIEKTGRRMNLVTTHNHHAMATLETLDQIVDVDFLKPNAIVTPATPPQERDLSNRKLIRVATAGEFRKDPDVFQELGGEKEKKPLLSLYPGAWDYSKGYQWGMSIDTSACIGCNACVVACQAENNIPVVGKEQVEKQREMHWLRIDDYFGGQDADHPQVYHQPVPCMHCENAPCEYVCPTGATAHSDDGLNQMTYNRCIGTRYCSNNCPYKVRRFNFLLFTEYMRDPLRKMQKNPEVTVRTRGVMEKCTYCIQRIQRTTIEAETALLDLREQARRTDDPAERERLLNEGKRTEFGLIDGLQTACQQACPTQAIVFGSINPVAGRGTRVMALKEEPLDYSLLRELTTKPRTTYMARLRNPNPVIESIEGGGA